MELKHAVLLLLLLVPSANAFTITTHPGWPQGFTTGCLYNSPVFSGYKTTLIRTAGSGGQSAFDCTTSYFRVHAEDGTYVEAGPYNGISSYSNPATADLDNNPSNGLETVYMLGNITHAQHSDGSIFWNKTFSSVGYTPAVADVNNDGALEIAIGIGSSLYLLDNQGNTLWQYNTGGSIYSSPAIGDLEGDGFFEIAVGNTNGAIHLLSHTGSLISTWSTGGSIKYSAPAFGDIDNDGSLEVVSGVSYSSGARVAAYKTDGTQIYKKQISSAQDIESSVALGDLNSDGYLEAVIGDNNLGRIHVVDHNGNYLSGWPASIPTGGVGLKSSPVLADVDGDSEIEVLAHAGFQSSLSILEPNGAMLSNTALNGESFWSAPAVGPLSSGKTGVAAVTRSNSYLFDASGTFDEMFTPWPMFHRDEANTGMHSPVAKIIAPENGSTHFRGADVTLNGAGLSIDGGVSFLWKSNRDGTIGATFSVVTSTLSMGAHDIWLEVTDPKGRKDTSAKTKITIINNPPQAYINLPLVSAVQEGEAITFNGTGSDSDGFIVNYTWMANSTTIYSNNTLNSPSVSSSFTYTLPPGTYTINFTLTDNNGNSTTSQKTIKINRPPVATIASPSNGSTFEVDQKIVFAGSGADADGTIDSYEWALNGSLISTKSAFIDSFSILGHLPLTLTVEDENGGTGTASITIEIKNTEAVLPTTIPPTTPPPTTIPPTGIPQNTIKPTTTQTPSHENTPKSTSQPSKSSTEDTSSNSQHTLSPQDSTEKSPSTQTSAETSLWQKMIGYIKNLLQELQCLISPSC